MRIDAVYSTANVINNLFDCRCCGTLSIYGCNIFLNSKKDERTKSSVGEKVAYSYKTLNIVRQPSEKLSYLPCQIYTSWFSLISCRFSSKIVSGFLSSRVDFRAMKRQIHFLSRILTLLLFFFKANPSKR